MVGYPHDVREVHLGPLGTLAGSPKGHLIIDMTTSQPSLAVEIYEAAKAQGVGSIDAPSLEATSAPETQLSPS